MRQDHFWILRGGEEVVSRLIIVFRRVFVVVRKQTRSVLNGFSVMDIGVPSEYFNSTIYQGVSLEMRVTQV